MRERCPNCGADPLKLEKRHSDNSGNQSGHGDDVYYVCSVCRKQIRKGEK